MSRAALGANFMDVNPHLYEIVRQAMLTNWPYDPNFLHFGTDLAAQICEKIIRITEQATLWKSTTGQRIKQACYILEHLDSNEFKPPVSRAIIEADILPLPDIDSMKIADAKTVIDHINLLRPAHIPAISKTGRRADLHRRLKFATYQDHRVLADVMVDFIRGDAEFAQYVYDRIPDWGGMPADPARITVDLTSPEPGVKHTSRYRPIDPNDPVFTMPLMELTSMLPRVSGEAEPFQSDDDIVIVAETLSDRCPITGAKIKTPVRGKQCQHSKCFDLWGFIEFAKQQKNWKCPQCPAELHPLKDLVLSESGFVDAMLT